LNCPVCEAPQESIYTCGSQAAVTSICTVVPTALNLRMCPHCALVQTTHSPALSLSGFWGEYHSVQAQNTDPGGVRAEREAGLMQEMMGLSRGARLMILGGVRLESARILHTRRPDLEIYAVLESPVYQERISTFVPAEHLAVAEIPSAWLGTFDAVASLYDLAHESDPIPHLEAMIDLLKPDGRLLVAVPNLLTNRGDLVVANHFTHFTFDSLRHLLQTVGLAEVRVDGSCFEGRLVATAIKAVASHHNLEPIVPSTFEAIRRIGHYWSEFGERVRAFESAQTEGPAAIYGAGFYGAFILSQLRSPDRIDIFFDGNTGLSGRSIASIPVCVPSKDGVDSPVLYMGLNPEIAAKVGENLRRNGRPTFFP
jgi:SAM-dependent methyltransferase